MTNPPITMELVRQAQAGDRAALERIFERYYDRVKRAIGIRMGPQVRSWAESGDIMARTFMKALEKFDAFEWRGDASLLKWLVTIGCGMVRDVKDQLTAQRRDHGRAVPMHVDRPDGSNAELQLPDPGARISRDLGVREDKEVVDRALENLEPDDREILLCYYFYEMSWEQIAEHLGMVEADEPSEKTRKDAADAARKRGATARARLAIEIQRLRRQHDGGQQD